MEDCASYGGFNPTPAPQSQLIAGPTLFAYCTTTATKQLLLESVPCRLSALKGTANYVNQGLGAKGLAVEN